MLMYPRELYGGYDAWYPCPTNVPLAEVQRGLIPARLAETVQASDHALPEFYREASLGMVFRTPLGGQPVALMGMHPEEALLKFPRTLDFVRYEERSLLLQWRKPRSDAAEVEQAVALALLLLPPPG